MGPSQCAVANYRALRSSRNPSGGSPGAQRAAQPCSPDPLAIRTPRAALSGRADGAGRVRSTHVEVTIPTQSPSATVAGSQYDRDCLQPCFDPLLEATVDDEEAFVQSTYHSYHAAAFTVSRASPLAPPCQQPDSSGTDAGGRRLRRVLFRLDSFKATWQYSRHQIPLVREAPHSSSRVVLRTKRNTTTLRLSADDSLSLAEILRKRGGSFRTATKPSGSSKRVVTVGGSGKAAAGRRKATEAEGGELRVKISVNSPPPASTSPTRSTASRRPLSARPLNGSRAGRCVFRVAVCSPRRSPFRAQHDGRKRGSPHWPHHGLDGFFERAGVACMCICVCVCGCVVTGIVARTLRSSSIQSIHGFIQYLALSALPRPCTHVPTRVRRIVRSLIVSFPSRRRDRPHHTAHHAD